MKKVLLLICMAVMLCCACSKSCTCVISTTNQDKELEIAYTDNCSDYSNSSQTCK